MSSNPALFEDYKIRRVYDEETETWFFSVIDVVQALTQPPVKENVFSVFTLCFKLIFFCVPTVWSHS